jgi:CDGSH-type Zn-finger protein
MGKKYADQAQKISGSDLDLTDAPDLCAFVRFCHNKNGNVWDLTEGSDNPDFKKEAIQQACNCSSGRLVAHDKKTGKAFEPNLEQSISIVEDPKTKTSGPICVKGGIKIESSDNEEYEIRNRVTLCRCGKSNNKPFCDASHVSVGFNDGDKSLKK